jgi:hypothetical protein
MLPSSSSTRAWRAPYSLLAILILFLLMVQARLWAPYWDTRDVQAILTWDAMGYYIYLPAHFIYHDLAHMAFVPDIIREYAPTTGFYQAFPVPGASDGQLVTKYTAGLALLWTPFFWLGHWAAAWFKYPQDGFSAPYQIAIAFGGLLYGLLGLGILRRVLLHYFSDLVTTLVLVLLALGSNYFQYAVFDAAMAHTYLFTGYALLLWLTIRWHEQPSRLRAFFIGLTLGIMVLIRPSEAVAVVIPVLWGLTSLAALRAKLELIKARWVDVLLLVLGGVLGVLPQGLYWHWATGHWLFYSYGDQHFNFIRPHLRSVLFSFRKGWLIYTPLVLMPLAGFAVLWRRHREVAVPALAFFLLNLWVVSAWDIWWYGGSLGQRAMVQSYAVLALPWAAAVAWLLAPQRRPWLKAVAVVGSVLLVDLNLFQHWQYMYSIIHPEEMNQHFYVAVFNKTKPTQVDYALLDGTPPLPRAERHYQPRGLGLLNFDQQPADPATGISADQGFFSHQSYHTDAARPYSPTLEVTAGAAGVKPGQFLRASCQVYSDNGAWGNKLVLMVQRNGKTQAWAGVRLQNNLSVSRRWNHIYYDFPLPADLQPGDQIKLYVLSENASACYVDDLALAAMEPKAE